MSDYEASDEESLDTPSIGTEIEEELAEGTREIKVPRDETNPAPFGYVSIQDRVNSLNGKLNPPIFEELLGIMVNQGWNELNPPTKANSYLVPGMRIRYTTKDGMFRTGGWVVKTDVGDDGDPYINYKAHNNTIWSLQLEEVERLFVIASRKKKRGGGKGRSKPVYENGLKAEPVVFKRPGVRTKHSVYLPDSEGNKVAVYFGKDAYAKSRFKETKKYARAKRYGWRFFEDDEIE